MDYEQATRIKLDMFLQIDSSTHVDPDTSLWHMAYLYDQGYDFGRIKRAQDEINRLVKHQLHKLEPRQNPIAPSEAAFAAAAP